MDRADLIAGVALSLLGFLMMFVIIPWGTEQGSYFGLSPTFFPTLLAVLATACALGLTLQAGRSLAGPPAGAMALHSNFISQ